MGDEELSDHSTSVREGMVRANQAREKWVNTLRSGDTTFKHVTDLSRTEEHKALASIRILSVISGRSGWTDRSAIEAMSHYGIGPKDTVKSIRRNPMKVEAVDKIMGSNPRMFRPRPEFPEGWPFSGKLSALYESMPDVEVPDELLDLMESNSDESPINEDDDSNDMDQLAMIMGGN